MSKNLPVLIIGAGPTGLMVACELARRGIAFRIIDKKAEPTISSNATWIQPGTLELFNHIGIVDPFVRKGHRCDAIHLHVKNKSLIRIPLEYIDSIYPFILMLSQAKTEELLAEYLLTFKYKIERSLELINVTQQNDSVISTIKFPNNQTETIKSDWLIACDGVNSTVRKQCNIFFPGDDLSEQFMVADAKMESFMFKNEIHVFFDKGTICGVFPMGHDNYRINANLHQEAPRKIFIDKEVVEIISERTDASYNIHSVSWISPFWIQGRLAKQMRKDCVFLAGDAAHTHSPAGGQGMNTGLQDAYNLAWKLALVIQGKAKKSLLDSYQAERHPVIKQLVEQTDQLTRMALFDRSAATKLIKFSDKIARSPVSFTKKITMKLTQLDIDYKDSPIIDYVDSINNHSPKSGHHFPNVMIESSKDLYQYLHNTQHNILLFTGPKNIKKKLSKLIELQQWLLSSFPELITVHIISPEKMSGIKSFIFDAEGVLHNHYQIKTAVIYILRPDNFIAYCSKKFSQKAIKEFFQHYLTC